MVRYAARHDVQVLGVTLSRQQALWANQAIADAGLADLAEVRHCDYRDVSETGFDAAVVDRAHRAHRGAQLPDLLPLDP